MQRVMNLLVIIPVLIASVWALSTENFRNEIGPTLRECKETLGASEDDFNAVYYLEKELFTETAKCLAACVLEKHGAMRNGRFLNVDADTRLAVFTRYFQDDPYRLTAAERVTYKCHREADEKFAGQEHAGVECQVVFDAIQCMLSGTLF